MLLTLTPWPNVPFSPAKGRVNPIGAERLFSVLFLTCVLLTQMLKPCEVAAETDNIQVRNEEKIAESNTKIARVPPGLGTHKPTYVLLTWTPYDEDRQRQEIKYQISFKQRVFPWGNLKEESKWYKLYFGLTMKSFWQVFDRAKSSPFRETNYNPEIFLRTPTFQTKWGIWTFDAGFEHESNGQDMPRSRSWDRLYVKPRWETGVFSAGYKLWYRLEEDEKDDPSDTRGDDNPDIEDYYGYSELNLRIDFAKRKARKYSIPLKYIYINKSSLNTMIRYNINKRKGAVQLDYWIPLMNAMKLHFQYWNGYGESLIDYNVRFIKYGVGLALTY